MDRRWKFFWLVFVAVVASVWATGIRSAHALMYDFEYKFINGETLSGTLEGNLHANGNTVDISALLTATYSGAPMGFQTALLHDTASLTGEPMMFRTVDGDGVSLGAFGLAFEGDAYLLNPNNTKLVLEGYSSCSWTMRESAPIPEPTTLLLLGTGLVGLVGFRKKFKK